MAMRTGDREIVDDNGITLFDKKIVKGVSMFGNRWTRMAAYRKLFPDGTSHTSLSRRWKLISAEHVCLYGFTKNSLVPPMFAIPGESSASGLVANVGSASGIEKEDVVVVVPTENAGPASGEDVVVVNPKDNDGSASGIEKEDVVVVPKENVGLEDVVVVVPTENAGPASGFEREDVVEKKKKNAGSAGIDLEATVKSNAMKLDTIYDFVKLSFGDLEKLTEVVGNLQKAISGLTDRIGTIEKNVTDSNSKETELAHTVAEILNLVKLLIPPGGLDDKKEENKSDKVGENK